MLSINTIRLRALVGFVAFFWACVPITTLVAYLDKVSVLGGTAGAALVATIATIAWRGGMARPAIEYLFAILGMVQVSIMVACAEGPWQIDFHMVYFAVLAMLAVFCNWKVIVVAAATAAVHHLTLSFLTPWLVFGNGGESILRVLFHAVIVVMETAVLAWLSHNMEKAFSNVETALAGTVVEVERLKREQIAAEEARRAELIALNHSLADRFASDVQTLTQRMDGAVRTLRHEAEIMGRQVSDTESATQGAKAEAADAVSHAASVAGTVEQMAATIAEVSQTVAATASRVRETTADVQNVERRVAELSDAASNIGNVVQLIASIAGQTNLLALNATIEAARAGEAGKGFAIVASEVKNLATQTARATEEISRQIAEIQAVTGTAVTAIGEVSRSIGAVDDSATDIAAAMRRQEGAVVEITQSIQAVSNRTASLGRVIGSMADVANKIADAIHKTSQTAADTEQMGSDMNKRLDAFIQQLRRAA
ncbi:methyl-accepting chemotaxis protein [Niveispirillum sp. BGYR6]|uniref:methyl-accepting chemotaxis protein n=1 Tax=Niveispirillum sp. BGYR6 TaxID=2971249 RepID=UPI0022B95EE4|nr:methyl-accepting chemotaxis protein [Niveispirillum sp. BGYR6]MDG5495847.1 methyl-accepting chemotaxis protein [Niveispirillum sp. BGYR6]